MPNARCPMPDARCQMANTRCQMPDGRHQMPAARWQVPRMPIRPRGTLGALRTEGAIGAPLTVEACPSPAAGSLPGALFTLPVLIKGCARWVAWHANRLARVLHGVATRGALNASFRWTAPNRRANWRKLTRRVVWHGSLQGGRHASTRNVARIRPSPPTSRVWSGHASLDGGGSPRGAPHVQRRADDCFGGMGRRQDDHLPRHEAA